MMAIDVANHPLARQLNLNHLSEDECEAVLKVIQRDFDLRQQEKERLNKIEEEVKDEDQKVTLLAKQRTFNENCCMRCFSRFIMLFNPKLQCHECKFFVCKNCSECDSTTKLYACHVCLKQKNLTKASGDWFYNNVKKKFKRFGSAKVVRSLYKRKTESEESDYAMSDSAIYGRDPSTGQKNRPQLTGAFEMDLDGPDTPIKPLERLKNDNSLVVEDDIVPQVRPDKLYNTPYTCSVGTGQKTFEEVRDTELKNFRTQLETIVQDINRTLANNLPMDNNANEDSGVNSREEYEKLVDNHRLHLSTALSNLTQSLQIAIDDQDISPPASSPLISQSPIAKHQLVKETIVKECEDYIGTKISLKDEDITSEYDSSESGTEQQSLKQYEDLLADTICKKLIDQHQIKQEEKDLLNSLTKISNKATLSQLNANLSESDTDTSCNVATRTIGDPENQVLESKVFSKNKSLVDDDDFDELVRSNLEGSHTSSIKKVGGDSLGNSYENDEWLHIESKKSPLGNKNVNSTSILESEVFTRDIENLGLSLNQKHSTPLKSEADVEQSEILLPVDIEEDLKILRESMNSSTQNYKVIEKHLEDEEVLDSALQAQNNNSEFVVKEEIIEPVAAFRDETDEQSSEDDGLDHFNASEFVKEHKVGLPSFEPTDEDAPSEVDLDDISHISSDMEEYPEDEIVVTLDGNITFGNNWSMTTRRGKDHSIITAYDNIGDKKVGKHGDTPTIMLVPAGATEGKELPTAMIGDVNVEDLSDLSENEARSDAELDYSSSEEENETEDRHPQNTGLTGADEGDFDAEGRFIVNSRPKSIKKRTRRIERSDSGVQTEDFDQLKSISEQGDSVDDKSVSGSDYSSPRDKKARTENLTESVTIENEPIDPALIEMKVKEKVFDINERPPSPDVEDVDPKFIVKPEKMLKIHEGEPVKFSVQVQGTRPIDVFWYNDMADIVDLADDDRCNVVQDSASGNYSCEMFNTRKSDQGQYLCIAINELAQCSRAFKLKVLDNTTNKSAPEFIRSLQDVEVLEGASVKLKCKLKGYPQPRVYWYRDGKQIKHSDEYKMEKIGNRDYVLTIVSATLLDDAEFLIVAKNVEGEARSIAQVIVEQKEEQSEGEEVESILSPSVKANTSYPDHVKELYPETDDLLRLAEQVQATRTEVEHHAEEMLMSADRLLRLEHDLNSMDQQLDRVADDSLLQPRGYSEDYNNDFLNMGFNSPVRKDDKMTESASNVRITTATALKYLTSMDDPLFERSNSPLDPEEDIDVNFTYEQYDILYKHRKISTENIRKGKIKRKELPKLHDFLRSVEKGEVQDVFKERKHDRLEFVADDGTTAVIDCGLKRVDSKRYKKDYIVVRDTPKVRRKQWEVKSSSAEGKDLIKSTPAGTREDPVQEIEEQEKEIRSPDSIEIGLDESVSSESDQEDAAVHDDNFNTQEMVNQMEEDVYLATSQVYELQDQIKEYEQKVNEINEDTSSRDLDQMERHVARMSAHVNKNDTEVTDIEAHWQQIEGGYSPHSRNTSEYAPPLPNTPQPLLSINESPVSKQQSHSVQLPSTQLSPYIDSHDNVEGQPGFMNIRLKRVENSAVEQEVAEQIHTPDDSYISSSMNTSRSSSQSDSLFANNNDQSDIRGEFQTMQTLSEQSSTSKPSYLDDLMDINFNLSEPNKTKQEQISTNSVVYQETNHSLKQNPTNLVEITDNSEMPSPNSASWDVTEAEEEELKHLPSVKNLLSRFNHSFVNEEDDQTSGFKRVYSLTGRDLPRSVREKIKTGGFKNVNPNMRVSDLSHPQHTQSKTRPHVSTVFEDYNLDNSRPDSGLGGSTGSGGLSPRGIAGPLSPNTSIAEDVDVSPNSELSGSIKSSVYGTPLLSTPQSNNKTDLSFSGSASSLKDNTNKLSMGSNNTYISEPVKALYVNTETPQQPIKSAVTIRQSLSPGVTISRSISDPSRSQSPRNVGNNNMKSKLVPPPKRGKNSAILARAAFWDSRINQEEGNDENIVNKFPEMPEDSFKSEEELSSSQEMITNT